MAVVLNQPVTIFLPLHVVNQQISLFHHWLDLEGKQLADLHLSYFGQTALLAEQIADGLQRHASGSLESCVEFLYLDLEASVGLLDLHLLLDLAGSVFHLEELCQPVEGFLLGFALHLPRRCSQQPEVGLLQPERIGLVGLGEEAEQVAEFELLLLGEEVEEAVEVHGVLVEVALGVLDLYLVFA